MALLTPSNKVESKQIKIKVNTDILEKALKYCEFSNIEQVDEFFEKTAAFVMDKDRDFQKFLTQKS